MSAIIVGVPVNQQSEIPIARAIPTPCSRNAHLATATVGAAAVAVAVARPISPPVAQHAGNVHGAIHSGHLMKRLRNGIGRDSNRRFTLFADRIEWGEGARVRQLALGANTATHYRSGTKTLFVRTGDKVLVVYPPNGSENDITAWTAAINDIVAQHQALQSMVVGVMPNKDLYLLAKLERQRRMRRAALFSALLLGLLILV